MQIFRIYSASKSKQNKFSQLSKLFKSHTDIINKITILP